MKNLFIAILLFSAISVCYGQTNHKGLSNPSADYCVFMGYKYQNIKDKDGGERGICIFPDSTSCDAWDFYRGKSHTKFSYCEKYGYTTINEIDTIKSFTTSCAKCVIRKNGYIVEKTPLFEFMRLRGDTLNKNVGN